MTGRNRALAGGVVWLASAFITTPAAREHAATYLLINFAALVTVPLLLDLLLEGDSTRLAGWMQRLQLPAAILLAFGFMLQPGALAVFVVLPWFLFTAMVAVAGLTGILLGRWHGSLGRGGGMVGMIYAGVGGIWVLVDRAGLRPFDFNGAAIALYAAHFHHAGLILPALIGRLIQHQPGRLALRAGVGVVLGVPAAALGVTFVQLGWGTSFSTAAHGGFALAGLVGGILLCRVARDKSLPGRARVLLAVAGLSLSGAMLLAGLHALRHTAIPLPRLEFTTMWAWHGALIAFGFGLAGVIGWRLAAVGEDR